MNTPNKGPYPRDRISRIIRLGENIFLGFFVLLLNIQFLLSPLLESWNYWPEWAPISPSLVSVLSSVRCLLFPMLVAMGAFALIAFSDSLRRNVSDLLDKNFSPGILYLLLIITIIPLSVIYVFESRYEIVNYYVRENIIEKNNIPQNEHNYSKIALMAFAASRYDPVIDAIKEYHTKHGEYPPNLDALVPDFLNATPGIYMKYGEYLSYSPTNPANFVDHSPYIFELYGHYSLSMMHGITLKYCPITIDPCYEGEKATRINERWIRVYSSPL